MMYLKSIARLLAASEEETVVRANKKYFKEIID